MLRIIRSIEKSKSFGYLNGIRVSPEKSSASYFYSISLKLAELTDYRTETGYIKKSLNFEL